MTSAIAAFGATLTWNSQTVAEITSISGPSIKVDALDVTSHGSTSAFREFIAGLADAGEISIDVNFYPGDTNGQKAMIDDAIARTSRTVVITGPAAAAFTWTATAIITGFDPGLPHDGSMSASFTLKITGVPTLAVTESSDLTTLTGIEENGETALTFLPTFDGATYVYNISVNTASDWVKFTPTLSGATITITTGYDDSSQDVASGAQSGTIALGAAGTVTTITLAVKETGKVAKNYTCHVYRASA